MIVQIDDCLALLNLVSISEITAFSITQLSLDLILFDHFKAIVFSTKFNYV